MFEAGGSCFMSAENRRLFARKNVMPIAMAPGPDTVNLTRSTDLNLSADALSADVADHAYTSNLPRSDVVVSSSTGHVQDNTNSMEQRAQDNDVDMEPNDLDETLDL